MKFTILPILLWGMLTAGMEAALPVVDAGLIAAQRVSSEKDYIEQLIQSGLQDSQARHLLEQISQIDENLRRMGDPGAIDQLPGAELLARLLREGQLSVTGERLLEGLEGREIIGSERSFGEVIQPEIRIDGQVVAARNLEQYKSEAALKRGLDQYWSVRSQVLVRRARIRAAVAENIELVRTASSVSEVQKLQIVGAALDAELAAVDRDLQLAAMEVEQLAELAKLSKEVERKARVEDERASFSEASKRDSATFRIQAKPVLFSR